MNIHKLKVFIVGFTIFSTTLVLHAESLKKGTLRLKSRDFINNSTIPPRFTCDGIDISPQLIGAMFLEAQKVSYLL